MKKDIAEKIFKKIANENGANYFHKHKILDSGDKRDVRESYTNPSHVSDIDLLSIAKHASTILDKELMKYNVEVAKQSAVELAIKTLADGKYDGKINSVNYFKILNLMNHSKTGGVNMKRTAKYYTDRLDKIANEIRNLVTEGKLEAKVGFNLEYALDQVSDELEVQAKQAKALEHDKDEKYMKDFGQDPATHEHDKDEDYMKEFHNFGQNVMSEAHEKGEFDPKKKASHLDARKLAARRK